MNYYVFLYRMRFVKVSMLWIKEPNTNKYQNKIMDKRMLMPKSVEFENARFLSLLYNLVKKKNCLLVLTKKLKCSIQEKK